MNKSHNEYRNKIWKIKIPFLGVKEGVLKNYSRLTP